MEFDIRLVADIHSSESCVLTAYRDTKNLWTIGWGHLLNQHTDWTGHVITQQQADDWFFADLGEAVMYAESFPEYLLMDTDCRRNAFVELMFNPGPTKWREFVDTRAALNRRDWKRAHDELLDSKWAVDVKSRRANRIANYLLTGMYPQGV